MNNEERNSSLENENVENDNLVDQVENFKPAAKTKLSGTVLTAIIAGIACILVAVILLVVLLPGKDNGPDGGEGTGDTDTKVTYTVTVVDGEGNPVKDVKITFAPKGGTAIPMPTDATGKITYKTDKEFTASVTEIPVGYEYAQLNKALTFDEDCKVTVTLTKVEEETVAYLIRVIDQNGEAVANAKVQMCEAGNEGLCLTPITTDENGEATYNETEKEYKAAITDLPDGYEEINEGAYVYFENGVAVITVNKK